MLIILKKISLYVVLTIFLSVITILMFVCENYIYGWIIFILLLLLFFIDKKVKLSRRKYYLLLVCLMILNLFSTKPLENGSIKSCLFRKISYYYGYNEVLAFIDDLGGGAVVKEDAFEYVVEKIDEEGLYMELLKNKEWNNDKVILQLHGGGYIHGLSDNYRRFAENYVYFSKGANVLTVDYRVAPQDIYPSALEDAVKAYKWLLNNGYEGKDIIIAGDSAGGGLALSTTLYLRDNNIQLPSGVIVMSPWTDLSNSTKSNIYNYKDDVVLGNVWGDSVLVNSSYIGKENPQNPYISPLFGDYNNFPKVLIQVGTCERLLNDSLDLEEKLKECNVEYNLSVYNGMLHVFQEYYNNPILSRIFPESEEAWQEVSRFINNCF